MFISNAFIYLNDKSPRIPVIVAKKIKKREGKIWSKFNLLSGFSGRWLLCMFVVV